MADIVVGPWSEESDIKLVVLVDVIKLTVKDAASKLNRTESSTRNHYYRVLRVDKPRHRELLRLAMRSDYRTTAMLPEPGSMVPA